MIWRIAKMTIKQKFGLALFIFGCANYTGWIVYMLSDKPHDWFFEIISMIIMAIGLINFVKEK
jgi:hypothetical protein